MKLLNPDFRDLPKKTYTARLGAFCIICKMSVTILYYHLIELLQGYKMMHVKCLAHCVPVYRKGLTNVASYYYLLLLLPERLAKWS